MNALVKRIERLELVHGGRVQDRLFVFLIALGPGPHNPIDGLSQGFSGGKFLSRIPGESVDALQARAVQVHPEVPVWVTRYTEAAPPPNFTLTPTVRSINECNQLNYPRYIRTG